MKTTPNTQTFKAQSFYIAYAPDTGVWAAGGCFEEAVNSLSDQLRASAGHRRRGDWLRKGSPAVKMRYNIACPGLI